jgi:hypothetical protein
MFRRTFWLLALAVSASCGGSSSRPPQAPGPVIPIAYGPESIIAAGDIGECGSLGHAATARLLDRLPGTILTLGDNAYPRGSLSEFTECYDATWGRHLDRTRPSPGNHEYETAGASGYFDYFGFRSGSPGYGYYSYRLGSWHMLALNSEVGVRDGSSQLAWLRAQLAENRSRCTLAYWHRPLFSSGRNGDQPDIRDFWRVLYEGNADVVLSAHDHLYERFVPQDPDGRLDSARGIRQFTIGTGGSTLTNPVALRANSEARISQWGVLAMTLNDGGYSWDFVPAEGGGSRDSGAGQCH